MSGQEVPRIVFLPERLNAEIDDRFLTNREVARMLDVDEKTVLRWRRGTSQPTRPSLRKMAQAFDREPAHFVEVREDIPEAA